VLQGLESISLLSEPRLASLVEWSLEAGPSPSCQSLNLPQSATLSDHIWTNKKCNEYKTGILINSLSDHFPVFRRYKTKYTKLIIKNHKKDKFKNNSIFL
jgi:hypothetical protein